MDAPPTTTTLIEERDGPKRFEPAEEDMCHGPDFPAELYYNAFALRTVSETQQPVSTAVGFVGGKPFLAPGQEWPVCNTHGPLTFVWCFRETETNWLSFFMCVDPEHRGHGSNKGRGRKGWIWPQMKCSSDSGSKVKICHAYVYDFAYCFLKAPITDDNPPPATSPTTVYELERAYLVMDPIKLVRPSPNFEKESDYYRVGNKFVSSDTMIEETSRAECEAWRNSAFLFKTKGLMVQDEIHRGYGYLVMGDNADSLSIWTLSNPGILNASKGLDLHHSI